jgi:hypothetical protein
MPVLAQTDPPRPARQTLPTMYDLPYDDLKDDDIADEFHSQQAFLLCETFQPATVPPDQVFSAINKYESRGSSALAEAPELVRGAWRAAVVPRPGLTFELSSSAKIIRNSRA